MRTERRSAVWLAAGVVLAVPLGCGAPGETRGTTIEPPWPPTTATSPTSGTESTAEGSDGGESTTGDDDDTSTGAVGTTAPIFDVYEPGTTTGACDEGDICCLDEGEFPPHALLDAFLLAYPPDAMPKTTAAIQAFEPMADGHSMAWSPAVVGDEIIDPKNGGISPANIETGRGVSRDQATMFMPATATLVSTRDEPVLSDPVMAPGGCVGTGWAWGSILFEDTDGSFGELVYLYMGHCAGDGDVERFFHSDETVVICDAIG